ncbi:MAG: SRPBCC domain-containing protein, partial [Ilumatobacteraceae bacterium]|nr:SRPBCC domain-containing protein [Ilumatobacteraceae bacterium]
MDLHHEFTVPVPAADAWKILTDLERLAPCLPGAQLTEIEGDIYRGQVKIKVGPILAQFKGQASFVSRDDTNFLASLKAEGRDTGGKGN